MGSTFRMLALESDHALLLRWFLDLPDAPEIVPARDRGAALYFRSIGPLAKTPAGVDVKSSPIVSLFAPRQRRGVLWTAAEVHFLATPGRRFPRLEAVSRALRTWLARHELVFANSVPRTRGWDHGLLGSLQNWDGEIRALPAAMAALRAGQTFVSEGDNDFVLDKVCHTLRLRGVEGIRG
jgi:hypothetical protein